MVNPTIDGWTLIKTLVEPIMPRPSKCQAIYQLF